MRCFRSFLNAVQSLNDKEAILSDEKQTKSEFGHLLLNKSNKDFNCYSQNWEFSQLNNLNKQNDCDKTNAKFNLTKFWIKNSLILDPFPDFKYNTVLVVNRGYKKRFKLV